MITKRLLTVAFCLIGCTGSIDELPPTPGGGGGVSPGGFGTQPAEPFKAQPAALPRLTFTQYRNSLTDIFGEGLPATPLEADTNPYLFYNIGGASTTLSERGVTQYDEAANTVAAWVFADGARRDRVVGCDAREATCRQEYLARIGRRLYRRPLSQDALDKWAAVADDLAEGDIYRGLQLATAGLLQSPLFLYRAEANVGSDDTRQLDDYEIATRLAFLMWNSGPDEALLDAAANGRLTTEEGLRDEAMRLLEDPRNDAAIQDFFAQYLDLGRLEQFERDAVDFPRYTPTLGESMRTEIEMRVRDIIVVRDSDIRELFFSRNSFINEELATLYEVPFIGATPDLFVPTQLPENRVGLLTSGAFLAMNAHPSETSPTLRGKYVRERILCQSVQPPPDEIDIDLTPDPNAPTRTLRERLEAHRDNPNCATCHDFVDPPGFLFEHYDSIGAWRDTEPGGEIDASGGLDDIPLSNAADLAAVLKDDERVMQCVVKQLYRHTMARLNAPAETAALVELETSFIESEYRFKELLVALATHEAFRTIAKEEGQ